ncbi:MAG: right-handed parallel beta-helix repeat-containing protein, partial [Phocaeicola sp.]|nr:right-handed parallel beta-helix repeat-containing protein [Phocaeicola sp.]
IHGTHLAVTSFTSDNQVTVRYMHPQTYGFQSFLAGNTIEFIDAHSLMPLGSFKVKNAEMKNEREIIITLNKPVPQDLKENKQLVVENVTYTPEVIIRNNYFSRIPTRGLLITTRRKVLIEENTFFRMQMSGILIADDARSWFESGMAHDVTIRNNHFIECGEPVIFIAPENDVNKGYVHRNIRIENNRFLLNGTQAVSAKSVNGLQVKGNLFICTPQIQAEELIQTKECDNITIKDNIVETKK